MTEYGIIAADVFGLRLAKLGIRHVGAGVFLPRNRDRTIERATERAASMKIDRSGMKLKAVVSGLVLAGLSVSAVWADGYNYGNDGFQRIYTSQGGASYPQYYSRIDPEPATSSPYYSQPYYSQPSYATSRPQYTARVSTPAKPHKTLGAKISDGLSDLWKSPSVKSGIAGGGIGLGAAALTKHMGLWHGTWVGAAYGAGFGLMDESFFFKRHPLMRRTAKGAIVGLGAATVTGAAALGPAAAVGAGVGAGIHLLKVH